MKTKITGKVNVVTLIKSESRKVEIPGQQTHRNKKRALRTDATGRKTTKHKKRDW